MHRSSNRILFDEERFARGKSEVWIPLPSTLNEARVADTFVILWGEYGGSTYLIAAARDVLCTQEGLDNVLAMLDQNDWDGFENAGIGFVAKQGSIVAVKRHHVRVGDDETWIARTLPNLTEPSTARLEGRTRGG